MCVQCAFDASKAAASSGGAAGLPGLAAAAVGMLGMRRLSGWLTTHEIGFATARAVTIATPILIWAGLIAFYAIRA